MPAEHDTRQLLQVRPATHGDCPRISQMAAATFALACPANTPAEELQRYIQDSLQAEHFDALLGDRNVQLRVVAQGVEVLGYSLLSLAPEPLGIEVADHMPELTRCYLDPSQHGSGAAQLLLEQTLAELDGAVRLTVNETNQRAIGFYRRNGFDIVGETTFLCGEDVHRDWVMLRAPRQG